MYYFTHDGVEYRVRFRHRQDAVGAIQQKINGKIRDFNGMTTVLVERRGPDKDEKKTWIQILTDNSYKSVSDPDFVRATGRQKALKRLARGIADKTFKQSMFQAIYG